VLTAPVLGSNTVRILRYVLYTIIIYFSGSPPSAAMSPTTILSNQLITNEYDIDELFDTCTSTFSKECFDPVLI